MNPDTTTGQPLTLMFVFPGVIGYFKFCKPNLTSPFSATHYSGPQYSPAGIGLGPYREQSHHAHGHYEGYAVSNDRFCKTSKKKKPVVIFKLVE